MREIWKDIEGYNGVYQVSNLGRVMSFKRKIPAIMTLTDNRGYKMVAMRLLGSSQHRYVHRLVAAAFIGPNNLDVNHKDLDKANNCLPNLEYVSEQENTRHARSLRGNWSAFGERNRNTKLTYEDLVQACKLLISGTPRKEIAKKFKITYDGVWRLKNRVQYAQAMKDAIACTLLEPFR